MYLEDIIFVGISLIDYLEYLFFSLSHIYAVCAFLADLDSNFFSILFLIDALDHLPKATCA